MIELPHVLYEAMRSKDARKLNELLENGIDILAKFDGETPLHHTSRFLRPDLASLLIACGTDINVKNHVGRTPIEVMPENHMLGGYERGLKLVRLLLEHNADLNPSRVSWNRSSLLHWALEGSGQYPIDAKDGVYKNSLAVVRMLTERGADIEVHDTSGSARRTTRSRTATKLLYSCF